MEETNDVRIGRYLSGEMTGIEREVFEKALLADTGLNATFLATKRIWDHQPGLDSPEWDVDAAWGRFSQESKLKDQPKPKRLYRIHYWAAAAIAILLIGIYAFYFNTGTPVIYAYQEGVSEPVELKDGSRIYLNKDSKITVYPFTPKKRHLQLQGEAYFEVAPDAKRPFTIATGGTITEVVGTSFNIREDADQTHIFVASGKIIFSSEKDARLAVALTEGEAARFHADKMEMIANPSPNVNAWRTQQLRFIKMPLSTVVADVSAYFSEQITIENEASKACIVNIPLSFKKPEISSVLKAVAASINAQLVKEGDSFIILGGRDCSN